jgi:UPF0716 protein FxsA
MNLALRTASPLYGILAFAAWIAAEVAAFNLVASWTGGGVAFFLLVMKSVLGAFFVQRIVRRKLFSVLRQGSVVLEGADAGVAWLKAIGAVLVIIPGFAAGLAGLALLTPTLQRWLIGRSAARRRNPRDIDLGDADWKEVAEEPKKRIRRQRPAGEA